MKFGHFYLLNVRLANGEITREQFITEYGAHQQKQGITTVWKKGGKS